MSLFNIKHLWKYITGDYVGLKRSLEKKLIDLERKRHDGEEYEDLINSIKSQIDELDRKIEEKHGKGKEDY